MKTAPLAGKSWQASHEPPCSKRNRHRSHCWISGKREGKGWEENCLGDELPHYEGGNTSCTYATLRYATIHKHVEFQPMRMCRHRWPPGERKRSLLLTSLNCTYTELFYCHSPRVQKGRTKMNPRVQKKGFRNGWSRILHLVPVSFFLV